jgi:hypothetical protein
MPGYDGQRSDFQVSQARVKLSPINHATLPELQAYILEQFAIVPATVHDFRIGWLNTLLTGEQPLNSILASTNLKELIELPSIKFVFTYDLVEKQLLH